MILRQKLIWREKQLAVMTRVVVLAGLLVQSSAFGSTAWAPGTPRIRQACSSNRPNAMAPIPLRMQRQGPGEDSDELPAGWGRVAINLEGHFKPIRPWVSIDETVEAGSARIVGASPEEVVIMNTLTTNLHLLMVSFYTPTSTRYKIIVEGKAFPSDAVRGRGGARLYTYVRRVTPHLLRCPVCYAWL